jgi:hypothetical protein
MFMSIIQYYMNKNKSVLFMVQKNKIKIVYSPITDAHF